MNEITKRKLNSSSTIMQALPRLIEAFVAFYGESEREKITTKFNKMIVAAYITPEKMNRFILEDLKNKSDVLMSEFFNTLQIDENKFEEFKNNIFGNYDLDYLNLHPIYNYILYIGGNSSKKQLALNFVQKFHPEITEDILDEAIHDGKLDKLNEIVEKYRLTLVRYAKYREEFKSYQEYIDKCNQLKSELQVKYTKIMLEKISFLFSSEEIKEMEEELNKPFGRIVRANKKAECYFGYNLNSQALIDAFSNESEQIIEEGIGWRCNSIINDRIKFFNNIGIKLGENYQDYVNFSGLAELFSQLRDTADTIILWRNLCYNSMMSEYYKTFDEYKQHKDKIEQAGLANNTSEFKVQDYQLGGTYVTNNVRKTESGYESVPVLCFSMAGLGEYLDHILIHELNHIYELSLQEVNEKEITSLCGWDIVTKKMNKDILEVDEKDNGDKRKYELFNEVINELIAQEITKILFDMDGYVFNTRDNAKIKGGTSYEYMRFLVASFYEQYKKEIIESRQTGDMNKLFAVVGKDNFEKLNSLCYEFNEYFAGFEFYNLMESLNKKEDNERTRKFYLIKQKRDQILMAMEEHRNLNKKISL